MTDDWPAPAPVIPPPAAGRVFRAGRRVRLGDVDATSVLRLDAAVRYLQDVAADDVWDVDLGDAAAWVVRRTTLEVGQRPVFGERVELATWCAGTGAAWTERRTTITGPAGPAVEAATLWVALDPGSLRPLPLPASFFAVYGEAAGDRRVKGRLRYPDRPPEGATAGQFVLRRSDLDVFRHVNNAVVWVLVEEEAARREGTVRSAELEYRSPIEAVDTLTVATVPTADGFALWATEHDSMTAAVVGRVELA